MSDECPIDLLMTVGEVAELGGVTRGYIRRLCIDGRLTAWKRSDVWVILAPSAIQWAQSYRKRGRKPKGYQSVSGEQLGLDGLGGSDVD